MKQCILSESRFDFLKDLVKNIPDASVQEDNENNVNEPPEYPPGCSYEEPEVKTRQDPVQEPSIIQDLSQGASRHGPLQLHQDVSRIQFQPHIQQNSVQLIQKPGLVQTSPVIQSPTRSKQNSLVGAKKSQDIVANFYTEQATSSGRAPVIQYGPKVIKIDNKLNSEAKLPVDSANVSNLTANATNFPLPDFAATEKNVKTATVTVTPKITPLDNVPPPLLPIPTTNNLYLQNTSDNLYIDEDYDN